jgi:hypothetical protein
LGESKVVSSMKSVLIPTKNEAIDELKENEFKDLYPEESNIETKEYVKDLLIPILNYCFRMRVHQ